MTWTRRSRRPTRCERWATALPVPSGSGTTGWPSSRLQLRGTRSRGSETTSATSVSWLRRVGRSRSSPMPTSGRSSGWSRSTRASRAGIGAIRKYATRWRAPGNAPGISRPRSARRRECVRTTCAGCAGSAARSHAVGRGPPEPAPDHRADRAQGRPSDRTDRLLLGRGRVRDRPRDSHLPHAARRGRRRYARRVAVAGRRRREHGIRHRAGERRRGQTSRASTRRGVTSDRHRAAVRCRHPGRDPSTRRHHPREGRGTALGGPRRLRAAGQCALLQRPRRGGRKESVRRRTGHRCGRSRRWRHSPVPGPDPRADGGLGRGPRPRPGSPDGAGRGTAPRGTRGRVRAGERRRSAAPVGAGVRRAREAGRLPARGCRVSGGRGGPGGGGDPGLDLGVPRRGRDAPEQETPRSSRSG